MRCKTQGPTLQLESTCCQFGALFAVRDLDLSLRSGSVHAIIGENGAGKSTALKLLAGHLAPSAGRVLVGGKMLSRATPRRAMMLGIGMVHQHSMLVEAFTGLENLALGGGISDGRRCGGLRFGGLRFGGLRGGGLRVVDLPAARKKANAVAQQADLTIDLERPVAQVSVGMRQRIEIVRVLYHGARALLLDEPTAVLSPVEVADLYRTLRRLANDGATVAVVTHRLDEVLRYCDEVTVLRRGTNVSYLTLAQPTEPKPTEPTDLLARLTSAMMGGEQPELAGAPNFESDGTKEALRLEAVKVERQDGIPALMDLSLTVRVGEIVGVAGIEGNGQRVLVRAVAGLQRLDGGKIDVSGEPLFRASATERSRNTRHENVQRARGAGVVVVHEDRHRDEILLDATVHDNLVLGDLPVAGENELVSSRLSRFDVVVAHPKRLVTELSGGNQQKLVMARALDRPVRVLVLHQPTRGVDVGTAATIHHAIAETARAGAGVLIVSADLQELRSLTHRIVVIRSGTIVATLSPQASDDEIGRPMVGAEVAS